jgi:hypothetical protein
MRGYAAGAFTPHLPTMLRIAGPSLSPPGEVNRAPLDHFSQREKEGPARVSEWEDEGLRC